MEHETLSWKSGQKVSYLDQKILAHQEVSVSLTQKSEQKVSYLGQKVILILAYQDVSVTLTHIPIFGQN